MKNFTLVIFFLLGSLAVVLSTDIASFVSNFQASESTTSSSSGSTLGSRTARAAQDDDASDDDDDDDKEKKTTALSSKTQNENTNGGSGGSKALKILRQHRIQSTSSSKTIKDEDSTTKRQSRHERAASGRVRNVHVARQAQIDADSAAPGAPGAPDDQQTSDSLSITPPVAVPQATGRQAPQSAPRPQSPPLQPAAGGAASLTLPDGAEVIVGDIKSGFTCVSRIYGYYADTFNDCKLFHVCVPVGDENGVTQPIQWSFVCGNQTLFNQEKLTCDYQDNVDCSKSESFYSINENFGRPEDKAAVAPGGPAPVAAPAPAPARG